MQSSTKYSLLASMFVGALACAHQEDPGDSADAIDDVGEDGGTGGSASAGKPGSIGGAPVGSAGTNKGGSTSLPPAGTNGGKGGKSSGGSAGKGGEPGTGEAGTDGGGDDPVNMPVVGLSVTFKPDSGDDNVDFIGGELQLINDTAQPFSLPNIKIRYYFGNEITAASPMVMMNWAQFGAVSNLGGATCTGQIAEASKPTTGADSYVELSCTASSGMDLSAGTLLKISWKAGAQGQGKWIQSDDWSLSDPEKILVLDGNTIVWGIEPK